MYTYDKKVLFSDIDRKGKMSLDKIIDAMQDCININSESIGRGIDYMLKVKRSWFAIGWDIHINRRPKMFEDVTVKTWPYDFSATFGYRNLVITDSNNEDIVYADSLWAIVDMDTGKLDRLTDEDMTGYDLEPQYPMEKIARKIKLGKDFEAVGEYVIKKADIDYNGHMTNSKYIQVAYEYFDDELSLNRIRVEYKTQSKYGEMLIIEKAVGCTPNSFAYRLIGKEDEQVRAVVELCY